MTYILPSQPGNKTPLGFLDRSRPLPMLQAEPIFDRLTLEKGARTDEVNAMMMLIGATLQSTKSYAKDEFWDNLEKVLVGRDRNIKHPTQTTDDGQMLLALGLFYPALNIIDSHAKSTGELTELKAIFDTTAKYVLGRLAPSASSKDKRLYDRVVDTIDARFDDVIERFNIKVEAQQMIGPAI